MIPRRNPDEIRRKADLPAIRVKCPIFDPVFWEVVFGPQSVCYYLAQGVPFWKFWNDVPKNDWTTEKLNNRSNFALHRSLADLWLVECECALIARPTLSITVDARSENDSGFFAVLAELIGQQTHSGSLVVRLAHCSLFNNRKK